MVIFKRPFLWSLRSPPAPAEFRLDLTLFQKEIDLVRTILPACRAQTPGPLSENDGCKATVLSDGDVSGLCRIDDFQAFSPPLVSITGQDPKKVLIFNGKYYIVFEQKLVNIKFQHVTSVLATVSSQFPKAE